MASKKNLLKKRKQAFNRRHPHQKTLKIESNYIGFNKKGEMILTDSYYKQAKKNTIVSAEKEKLMLYVNEFNIENYNKKSKDYSSLVNSINEHSKKTKAILQTQQKIQKIKQNRLQKNKKSTTNTKSIVTSNRLRHAKNLFNTISIDRNIRELAENIGENFEFIRDLIFPTFDEQTSYEEMQNANSQHEQEFTDLLQDKLQNNKINEETFEKCENLFNLIIYT